MTQKRMISMRYWLTGAQFFNALSAMEFAARHHDGFRKDGVTPEFDHQVSIAHYVRTLRDLRDLESTLAVVFLHDIREDKGISDEQIRQMFGAKVADAVWKLTKKWDGKKRDAKTLFAEMATCPIASVAKGADRIHNFNSMGGVFTHEKQLAYIEECEEFFLPMLKEARRNFPDQEAAYENIKHMLKSQIALIRRVA